MSCLSREVANFLNETPSFCSKNQTDVIAAVIALSTKKYVPYHDPAIASGEVARVAIGCTVVMANFFLLFFLNARASMRKKYVLYTFVTIGDLLDGAYLIYPSFRRIYEMAMGLYYFRIPMWSCTVKQYMLFRICGTELVATSMVAMSAERLCAVWFPMFYRRHSSPKLRVLAGGCCVGIVATSYSAMMISASMDGRATFAPDNYCGISASVTETFATFHQNFNLACQIAAFIMCVIAFMTAWWQARKLPNLRAELNTIKPVLVTSFVTCVLISANNIVYLMKNNFKLPVTVAMQNIVVSYSPAVFQTSKFILYLLTGKDFRDSLRKIIDSDSTAVTVVPRATFRQPSTAITVT